MRPCWLGWLVRQGCLIAQLASSAQKSIHSIVPCVDQTTMAMVKGSATHMICGHAHAHGFSHSIRGLGLRHGHCASTCAWGMIVYLVCIRLLDGGLPDISD